MGKHVAKTLLTIVPTLFGVITIIFLLIHLTPGDPALAILGPHATAETVMDLRKSLGLDRPLYVQYLKFLGGLLQGDLGRSVVSHTPVLMEILRPFPYTIHLALAGTIISVILGIPLGVISAVRRNTFLDYFVRAASISGISVPFFFLAILLLWIFSYKLGLFPIIGVGDISSWRSLLYHLMLPSPDHRHQYGRADYALNEILHAGGLKPGLCPDGKG